MLEIIKYPEIDADPYVSLLEAKAANHLLDAASQLEGISIFHVNSTAYGGGVAEILHSMVPLSNALGVSTERVVITPKDVRFFDVTKRIHNMLQGADGKLSEDELAIYYGCLDDVAEEIEQTGLAADIWFLHDPQLLPLAHAFESKRGPSSHLDCSYRP